MPLLDTLPQAASDEGTSDEKDIKNLGQAT